MHQLHELDRYVVAWPEHRKGTRWHRLSCIVYDDSYWGSRFTFVYTPRFTLLGRRMSYPQATGYYTDLHATNLLIARSRARSGVNLSIYSTFYRRLVTHQRNWFRPRGDETFQSFFPQGW
jgi:hypothetical protein